jgi:alpha-N-arabinofuranosidase
MMKSLAALAAAVLLAATPALADTFNVTLDTAKTSAPISKYIYGQFIEHLGRSVYAARRLCQKEQHDRPIDVEGGPQRDSGRLR